MYYTWCKLEGRMAFKTYEEMCLHWKQIDSDPYARYWDSFGCNRNGGERVSFEKTRG